MAITSTGFYLVIFISMISYLEISFCSDSSTFKDHDCVFEKAISETERKTAESRLAPLILNTYKIKDKKYTYYVSICKKIDNTFVSNLMSGKDDVGVLQVNTSKTTEQYSLGSVKYTEFMYGSNWMSLEYEHGDKHTNKDHCGNEGKRSIIMIICDENESEGNMRLIQENNDKSDDCYYLFELSHVKACKLINNNSSKLSIGSVLIIIFFTLSIVYLFGGIIYRRLFVGAKGWEQLPNYEFWRDFGNLQAEGCLFICSSRQAESRHYRGIGDEQLDNGDIEKDDHLLPM